MASDSRVINYSRAMPASGYRKQHGAQTGRDHGVLLGAESAETIAWIWVTSGAACAGASDKKAFFRRYERPPVWTA